MTTLQAADIFDELGELEEHRDKRVNVERTSTLDTFFRGLEMLIDECQVPEIFEELPLSKYSARDIEAFSLMLNSEDYKTSLFGFNAAKWLNALIKRCPDEKITIHTRYLSNHLPHIGTGNESRHITVNGDVGDLCGLRMRSGTIHVNGNAGSDVGGNMSGGTIIIEGNVKGFIGSDMNGGKIYLNGSYGRISDFVYDGNIYHKGEIIVRNGKKL